MNTNPHTDDLYYFEMTKEMILNHVDLNKYAVFLFGSQAIKPISRKSDIDIGILGNEKMPLVKILELKSMIENSIIPFKVDIVDFFGANSDFKQIALKNIVIWNQPNSIDIK